MNRSLRARLPLLAIALILCPATSWAQGDPGAAERLTAEAESALAGGDHSAAIERAFAALDQVEAYVPAVRVLAEAQMAAGQLDEALLSLRWWAPETPDGELQGEFRQLFERAARARMAEYERLAAAEEDAGVASMQRKGAAELAAEIGDLAAALAIYSKTIGWDGDEALLSRAAVYERLGERELALADYRRHVGSGSASGQAARALVVLSEACSTDEALQADLALALDTLPEGDRAWLHERQGPAQERLRDALREYAGILRYRPELAPSDAGSAGRAATTGLGIEPWHDLCAWADVIAAFGALALERGDGATARERFDTARAACPTFDPPQKMAEIVAQRVLAGELEAALSAADALVAHVDTPSARLVRAQVHDLLGHYEPAVADYRAGLTGAPATNLDWLLLFDLEREHGDHAGIAADCARALAAWPDDEVALAWRVQALVALGDKGQAIAILDEAHQRSPDDVRLRSRRLELLARAGDFERLHAEGLALIRERAPGFVDVALLLAREAAAADRTEALLAVAVDEPLVRPLVVTMVSFVVDDLSDAEAKVALLKNLIGDDPSFVCFEAAVTTRQGKRQEAREKLLALPDGAIDEAWAVLIAAQVPRRDPYWTDGREHALELLELLAQACPRSAAVAGHLAERAAFYLDELEAGPRRERELAERRQRAQALYDEALAADKSGERARAKAGYWQALELDPEHSRAAMRLAVHMLVAGDGAAARETVRATELAPALERVYLRGEMPSDRILQLIGNDTLEKFPPHAGPWSWNDAVLAVCELYGQIHDNGQEVELMADMQVEANDHVMLEKRARAAWDGGAYDDALAGARRCVELRPDDARLRVFLAEIHATRDELEQAYAVLGEAIARFPSEAQLHRERAELRYHEYSLGGDTANARLALEDAQRAFALGGGRDALSIQAYAHDALGEWEQAYDCVERMYQMDPNAWLPQLARSAELRVQNFHDKLREGAERGRVQDEARIAEERAKQQAAEEARIAAENAFHAERNAEEVRRIERARGALDRISSSGSLWGDSAFNRMVDANWAAGMAIDRRMADEAAANARVHEIERRFGYYSHAAESARSYR